MNYAGVGFAFVTCLFLGAGIGMIFNNLELGGALGLGAGFLILALFRKKG
ncbi:hypothetical protein QGM71_18420 [Virgibacillus sp. C22-A2]|uniref:Glycine zipper family protein n=1 Tax=Virgibacillus tibetensis TaxID=3042313 RepID=A0ABU6KJG0_9BACI|nr:hypothetical protein [Virgibacillus sp. C22-A2]